MNTPKPAATPGPYRADLHHTRRDGGRTYGFVRGPGIVPIAAVTLGVEGMSEGEGRANCHLLASSWDMRETLRATSEALAWCVEHSGECLGDMPAELAIAATLVREARAVLAKAGEAT
jgi:hypothetical protein